ncbi:MAG: nucleotidyltransferase family protein [Acidobacteriota bacterium]
MTRPTMFDHVSDLFISPDHSIAKVLQVLDRGGVGLVLMVARDGRLMGTITDGDVRRALLRNSQLSERASSIMNRHPVTARVGTSRNKLASMMRQRRKRQIPLLDRDDRVADIAILDQIFSITDDPAPARTAVIMCGGPGKRLRPLTTSIPKPMLTVGGQPVLERLIKGLAGNHFRTVFLAVNYHADQIETYFGDGHPWQVNIQYIREPNYLGTAGALALLPRQLTEPILVVNGDLLTAVKYSNLLEFHLERGFDLTVGVKPYRVEVPYGVVGDLQGDQILELTEKPAYSFLANLGIYILNPEVIALVPTSSTFDMTELIRKVLDRHGRVGAYPVHEYWIDMGELPQYHQAHLDADNGIFPP